MKKLAFLWTCIFFLVFSSNLVLSNDVHINSFEISSDLDNINEHDGSFYGILQNDYLTIDINLTVYDTDWDFDDKNIKIKSNEITNNEDIEFEEDDCEQTDEHNYSCNTNFDLIDYDVDSSSLDYNDNFEFEIVILSNEGVTYSGNVAGNTNSFVCYNSFDESEFEDISISDPIITEDDISFEFDMSDFNPNINNCPSLDIESVRANLVLDEDNNRFTSNVSNKLTFSDTSNLEGGSYNLTLSFHPNYGSVYNLEKEYQLYLDGPIIEDVKLKNHVINQEIFNEYIYDPDEDRYTCSYLKFVINDPFFEGINLDVSDVNQDFFDDNEPIILNKDGFGCEKDDDNEDMIICRSNVDPYGCFNILSSNFDIEFEVCSSPENYDEDLCVEDSSSYSLEINNDGPELIDWKSYTTFSDDLDFDEDDLEILANEMIKNVSNSFFGENLIFQNCYDDECFFRDGVPINYTLTLNNPNLNHDSASFDFSEIGGSQENSDYLFNDESSTTFGLNRTLNDNYDNFSIPLSGTDSLGNSFSFSDVRFYHDDKPPIIENVSAYRATGGSYAKDTIATNDRILINITANDSISSNVGFIVDFNDLTTSHEIKKGYCEKTKKNTFNCEVESERSVSAKNVGGEGEIEIYVFDLAGNVIKETKNVEILETSDDDTPEISLYADNFVPDFIDRKMVSIFEYPIHGELNTQAPSGVYIDNQYFNDCSFVNYARELYSFDLISPTSLEDDSSTMMFDLPIFEEDDLNNVEELKISCNVETFLRTDTHIYTRPNNQNVNFTLNVKNAPFGMPSEEIYNEVSENIDSFIVEHGDFLHTAANIHRFAENICSLREGLATSEFGVSVGGGIVQGSEIIIDGIGTAVPAARPFTEPIAQALNMIESGLDVAHNTINSVFETTFELVDFGGGDGEKGVLGRVCDYVMCDQCDPIDSATFVGDMWGDSVDDHYVFGKDISGKVDPTESMVLSMGCGCLGPIIYKMESWRQMKCERDLCLLQGGALGAETIHCRQAYIEQKCKLIVGEAYVLFPYGMGIDSYFSEINDMLSIDPDFIENAVGQLICPESGGKSDIGNIAGDFLPDVGGSLGDLRKWICNIGEGAFKVERGINMIQESYDIYDRDGISGLLAHEAGLAGVSDSLSDYWGDIWKDDPCNQTIELMQELEGDA